MTDQFDRFADSASRTLDALGWDATVEVYQPTESYVAGEGFSVEYPDAPTATLDGALDVPSDSPNIDAGGTTETSDLAVYVTGGIGFGNNFADLFGSALNTVGDSGEAKTGVEVAGQQYVVDTVEDQFDGLLELACDEVDEWP